MTSAPRWRKRGLTRTFRAGRRVIVVGVELTPRGTLWWNRPRNDKWQCRNDHIISLTRSWYPVLKLYVWKLTILRFRLFWGKVVAWRK